MLNGFGDEDVMDQEFFEEKLEELVRELGALPDSTHQKLLEIANQHKDNQKKLKNSLCALQDSLDYLRISVKYLIFDLEATRRENAYLKKLLEEKQE
ncbi:MAG TPA: hypothetical protein PK965_09560 [Anaerohalosphaeraceae bacterium]|nr:hypothetical protein [Anaerohalosphaeraceae bacterium]